MLHGTQRSQYCKRSSIVAEQPQRSCKDGTGCNTGDSDFLYEFYDLYNDGKHKEAAAYIERLIETQPQLRQWVEAKVAKASKLIDELQQYEQKHSKYFKKKEQKSA